MSKEILLNKLEKQFSYYELVDEMQETINYSKIVDFLDNEKDKQIADLEAKLAEKDKEIKKLKQLVKAVDIYNQYSNDAKNLILLNPDNCYTNGHQIVIKTNNQDKINYAVEKLERVKEEMQLNGSDYCEIRQYTSNQNDYAWFNYVCFRNYINQLITEIKEGK